MSRRDDAAARVPVRRLVGSLALASMIVGGCGASEKDSSGEQTRSTDVPSSIVSPSQAASSSASGSTQPTKADLVEVRIALRNGDVTPPPHRVKITKGETVRLTVSADVREEVHVHGYDVSKNVRPGRPATLEFVADQQGVFEVELEHSGLQLVQLQVR